MSGYAYASHLGPLGLVVAMTDGPVLELGGGLISTPALHWMCQPDRLLVTLEEDGAWFKKLQPYANETHLIRHVGLWPQVYPILTEPWDVAFIDNEIPTTDGKYRPYSLRLDLVQRVNSRFVVVHDTEDPAFYDKSVWEGYESVWTFKPEGLPWTTVASRNTDFAKLLQNHWSVPSWQTART